MPEKCYHARFLRFPDSWPCMLQCLTHINPLLPIPTGSYQVGSSTEESDLIWSLQLGETYVQQVHTNISTIQKGHPARDDGLRIPGCRNVCGSSLSFSESFRLSMFMHFCHWTGTTGAAVTEQGWGGGSPSGDAKKWQSEVQTQTMLNPPEEPLYFSWFSYVYPNFYLVLFPSWTIWASL